MQRDLISLTIYFEVYEFFQLLILCLFLSNQNLSNIPSSNIEENSNLLDNLEEDMEEAQIIEPSVYQNIVDFISNNTGD